MMCKTSKCLLNFLIPYLSYWTFVVITSEVFCIMKKSHHPYMIPLKYRFCNHGPLMQAKFYWKVFFLSYLPRKWSRNDKVWKIAILRSFFPALSMNHHLLLVKKNILLKIFCTLFLFYASWLEETICQGRESGISWEIYKHSIETGIIKTWGAGENLGGIYLIHKQKDTHLC